MERRKFCLSHFGNFTVYSLYTLKTHYKTRVKPPEHITIPTNIIIHKQILAET